MNRIRPKRLAGIFLLAFISLHLSAQRLTPQFGVLTDADKAFSSYEPEPEAPAVVLFDIGSSYFFDTPDGGYNIRFTRNRRTKIFSRAGIEHATVSIPFYFENPTKKETVASIEAYTYNLKDGLVYKKALEPSAVFEEKVSNFLRVKKFTFPDVQDGAIVEYKYVIETPFHFNLPDWEFQGKAPVVYSEYTINMIPFYEYIFIAQGITKFDYQKSEVSKKKRLFGSVTEALGGRTGGGVEFSDMVHTYAMKNVPSFTDESYVTSASDYIMKMDFQLSKFNRPTGGSTDVITTWPALNKAMLNNESFGKFLSASGRIAKKLLEKELILTETDREKKTEALVQYVRSNFAWNEVDDNFCHKSAKEFFEQKAGNSAEINLFLCALLNAAEIAAEPVLISTRSHGKIKTDYPFDHYFNSVLVLVKGPNAYLTEGTESLIAYNRIPLRCINERGLLVSEYEVIWLSLEPRVQSVDEKILSIKVNADQRTAAVTGQIQSTEYQALNRKTRFKNDSTEFRKYLKETHQVEAIETRMYSYDRPRVPYVIQFKGTVPLEIVDNSLVVQPLLGFPMKENPLRQANRTYPVDFIYPQNSRMKVTVTVPEGYTVSQMPEAIQMDNEIAQINFKHTLSGNELTVTADYQLKKGVYSAAEYGKLKFYLGMIVKAFNTPVVMQKR